MIEKERLSNFELLRIVAMFMVLLVHADFFSLGEPTAEECVTNPKDVIPRLLFWSLSIACVDIFVLISGWFGIKPRAKGICNFLFQCFFWLIGIYVVTCIIGISHLSVNGILGCIVATELNWFIKAYLVLYIMSPALNSLVEHSSKKTLCTVLVGFYIFQFIYGWIFPSATRYILGGYNPLSFMGLYLFARYLKNYGSRFFYYSKITYILLIVGSIIFVSTLYILPSYLGFHTVTLGLIFLNYISPTTLLVAVSFLLLFSKIEIKSKFVNWCGVSCFAVFLIHTNPNTLYIYKDFFIKLHLNSTTITFWTMAFVYMFVLFFVAIIIDQLRLKLWNVLWPILEKKILKKIVGM